MRLGAVIVSGNDQREACLREFRSYAKERGLDVDTQHAIRRAERIGIGGYHDTGNGNYCIASLFKPDESCRIQIVTCEFAGQSYRWEVEVSERQGFLEHLGIEEQGGDNFNFFNLQEVESGKRKALSMPSQRDLAYVLIRNGEEICATVVDLRNPDNSEFYRWRVENPKQDNGGELLLEKT